VVHDSLPLHVWSPQPPVQVPQSVAHVRQLSPVSQIALPQLALHAPQSIAHE